MKKLTKFIAIFLCLFLAFNISKAQNNNFQIKGTLLDSGTKEPIAYGTVAIISAESNKIIGGAATNDDGHFTLTAGDKNIYIEISFIGYDKDTIRDFDRTKNSIDLGEVLLRQDAQVVDEVTVQGEKSTVEFKLDKRVFNVGKDISSTGMGALEVLNNVPSVNVDLEGTITLRGNSGVQMLIDGKPSVLADEGSNALGTITADMIEKVEVITNPSAKYDAEGTSGIINIVLKKEEKKDLNGSVSLNTGIPDNHSIGVSLNKRADKFNFFTQFGGGYRTYPEDSKTINTDLTDNTSLESNAERFKHEQFYNFTLGADYYINELNIITLSGNCAYEFEDESSETDYSRFYSSNNTTSLWERDETTSAENPKWQFDLQYKKQFEDNEDHVLLASAQGNFFGKDQSSEYKNYSTQNIVLDDDQNIETDFFQNNYIFKVDYADPISESVSIEAGGSYVINEVGNDYAVFNYTDNVWEQDFDYSNNFELDQKVLGAYSTVSYEMDKWGLKAGLRLENTNLNTLLKTTNDENGQKYTDLFPSVHASYKLSGKLSLQAGYSRRIYRPRLWDLNPFHNIRNSYSIRTGNPDLLPQYADSYEITGILIYDKLSLNSSLYHLYTTDVVERISTYENGVGISKPLNIGTNSKIGLSVNGKYTPVKWITLNGDFNYGTYTREGSYNDEDIDFSAEQWSSKLTSKIKLPADMDLEITGNYQSDNKTVQGEVSGYAFADAGLRKKMLKGKVMLNLSVRDLFESRMRESFVNEESYTLYSFSERGRFVTLGVSYGFGKGDAMYYYGGKR